MFARFRKVLFVAFCAALISPNPISAKEVKVLCPAACMQYVEKVSAREWYANVIHDQAFLVCTRARESRGDYSVVSSNGLWHGAYQFTTETFNNTATHRGWLHLVGVLPEEASIADQDFMAWELYQWQGSTPWGGRCS